MSVKSAVVSFVSGKAAKFHRESHNARAKQYCRGCDICEMEGKFRNPVYEIIRPDLEKGMTQILVGIRPQLHPKQYNSPRFTAVR